MIGKKIGRLTVIEQAGKDKWNKTRWKCLCDCGNTKIVGRSNFSNTKSCGCLKKELMEKATRTHGLRNHKLYNVWNSIKSRCYRKNNHAYMNYGGRGIELCEEWHDFKNFYDWAISEGYKEGLSIDRINVNGNYEPVNCRWANQYEQSNNTRANLKYEYNGDIKTLAEICSDLNLKYNTVYMRIRRGKTFEQAIGKWEGNKVEKK